jgi:hypothetical protein
VLFSNSESCDHISSLPGLDPCIRRQNRLPLDRADHTGGGTVIRDEMKGQNLSFIEIAKLVGERWQALAPAEKEPFETRALQAKERYSRELAEYRKTAEYRQYAQYLQEFKAKQAQSQGLSALKLLEPRVLAP